MRKYFRDVRIGDVIRLPKAGFQIVSMRSLVSQSDKDVIEVNCECTDPSLVGVRGKFIILADDKIDIIARNTLGKRVAAWAGSLFTRKTKAPIKDDPRRHLPPHMSE